MPIEFTKPTITGELRMPQAFQNVSFPYFQLNHRRFEELLYSISKARIDGGAWKGKYDEVFLMQGVRDKGRDCSLYLNGKATGVIQCKHYQNNITKPNCAREIIKFVLHSLQDDRLIGQLDEFIYWFAVSSGFNDEAITLLSDFNNEIFNIENFQEETQKVISTYQALSELEYSEIEHSFRNVLSKITVKRLLPQDLDELLNEEPIIIRTFFEIKKVVDNEAVERIEMEIAELGIYSDTTNIPYDKILNQFKHASSQLLQYQSDLENVPNSHIARKETMQIIDWVKSPLTLNEEPVILLVGSPGSGKTVILQDVYKALEKDEIPVLGIKADRYYIQSISELEQRLDLEDRIEKIARTLGNNGERVVILIDQIDALSQSLSANRDFINTYNMLVRKLVEIENIRIVISIREFDLFYDHDLKFYKNQKSITVDKLDRQEVINVLKKLGIIEKIIPESLIILLLTVQHLNVFCRIYNSEINLNSFLTLNDLYKELWNEKIVRLPSSLQSNSEKLESFIGLISQKMSDSQQITFLSDELPENTETEYSYLRSVGILIESFGVVQFFHQSFFDFVFSRLFLKSERKLVDYLAKNHQGLFVRTIVKMITGFLREQNQSEYINTLNEIILSPNFRYHLKLLLIHQLAFIQNPSIKEKEFILNKVKKRSSLLQPFLEAIRSDEWMNFCFEKDILIELIEVRKNWYDLMRRNLPVKMHDFILQYESRFKYLPYEKKRDNNLNLLWRLFYNNLPRSRKSICNFLLNGEDFYKKSNFSLRILNQIKKWDFQGSFNLFDKYESISHQELFHSLNALEDASEYNLKWVLEKYSIRCDHLIEATSLESTKPPIDHHDTELLKKIFEVDAIKSSEYAFSLIKRIIKKTSPNEKNKLYIDLAFWTFTYGRGRIPQGHELILQLLIENLQRLAKDFTNEFLKFYNNNKDSNSITVLRILCLGLYSNPKNLYNEVFEFINIIQNKNGLDQGDKLQFELRQLITVSFEYLNETQKDKVLKIISSIISEYELNIITYEGKKQTRLKWFGYTKFQYLKSIPFDEINKRPFLKMMYLELNRKFPNIEDEEPNKFGAHVVGPPLVKNAYNKMTFSQWELSFLKYSSDNLKDPLSYKGSIVEHSREFERCVKENPSRFFPFIELLIKNRNVPDKYLVAGLNGLKEAKFEPEELKRLFKLAIIYDFDRELTLYLIWLSSYFIDTRVIDDEVLKFLIKNATSHPDPVNNKILNDPLMDGGNNVRGAAAQRICYFYFNPDFENQIFNALYQIVQDSNISVRVSVIAHVAYLMHLNEDRVLNLFLELVESNEEEIIKYSVRTAQYLANSNFSKMKEYFMNTIQIDEIQDQVAVLLFVAWLRDVDGAKELLFIVLSKNNAAIARVIDAAIKNMSDESEIVRAKCGNIYIRYLNSSDEKIINEYSFGFLDLDPASFTDIFYLLKQYSKSSVAKKQPREYFNYLKKSATSHPMECFELLKEAVHYEKPNITKAGHYDDEPIKVLIQIYNSLLKAKDENMFNLQNCMLLFDEMLKDPELRNSAEKAMSFAE